jgi:hypothetical protein
MTHMGRLRGRTLAGVLAALGCLLVVMGIVVFAHRSSPAPAGHQVATQPVYLPYGIVFTPTPLPTDAHYLTADEAWMEWEHGHHLSSGITAEFGLLTYEGRHLVWGFSAPGCAMPNGWPSKRQVALVSSLKCREWTFLNPKTGRQIVTTDLYPAKP